MKSAVPFCFENILKLREKVRENLVCSLMWGILEIKRKFNIATIVILYRLGWLNKWWFG